MITYLLFRVLDYSDLHINFSETADELLSVHATVKSAAKEKEKISIKKPKETFYIETWEVIE